ncbi:MAG: regulatory iron-sulfur-containing complex subunit RicT [Chitinophagales bacterium]|nr:hypothetical protein [Chitinophagales bacterium]MDW8393139.1 regulatory iron-sulfur-containing complex subunit RicT [Chitinophagales bacterium]
MACNGCTVGIKGKPPGCRSFGNCTTGSCNRLNSYDWLADLPIPAAQVFPYVEVSFKNGSRKAFYANHQQLPISARDIVVVEAAIGYDMGVVTLTGATTLLQMKKKNVDPAKKGEVRSILRLATEVDLQRWEQVRSKEKPTLIRTRSIVAQMNLDMKVSDVEYQADGRKATFYYTADHRVDFRELIRVLAREFHVKVEMHQMGSRQEAGRIGGIGSCGRELCCSTWLTQFRNVTTAAARYQQLAINHAKLAGQCGRLKCCLNYELDLYLEALKTLPMAAEKLETRAGIAVLQKADIFKNVMYYAYKNSTKQFALTPEQVRKIQSMNQSGQQPDDLSTWTQPQQPAATVEFSNVVGQVSLQALERQDSRRKKKKRHKKGSRPNSRNGSA